MWGKTLEVRHEVQLIKLGTMFGDSGSTGASRDSKINDTRAYTGMMRVDGEDAVLERNRGLLVITFALIRPILFDY